MDHQVLRIELDSSRLLGFKQAHTAGSGKLSGPRAKVGAIIPVAPEPSSYAMLAAGLLCFLGFYLFRRARTRRAAQS